MKSKGITPKQKGSAAGEVWAIRGIDAETKTAVTIAARKAGQTVGEWCNRTLRDAATARLKERVPGLTIEATLAKLAESMARQAEAVQQQNLAVLARLEAVEHREQEAAKAGGGNPLAWVHAFFPWLKSPKG